MFDEHENNLLDTHHDRISWDGITYGSYHDVSVVEHWLPYNVLLAGAAIFWAGLLCLLLYYPSSQSAYLRVAIYWGLASLPAIMVFLFLAYPNRDTVNRSRIENAFDGEFDARNAAELMKEIKSKSFFEEQVRSQAVQNDN